MKAELLLRISRWFMFGVLCLCTANAWALPPLTRRVPGIIQSIDHEARTLTVMPDKGKGPVLLIWKNDTLFLYNGQFTNAAALKEGTSAVAYYRAPLFGKAFATKLVWRMAGSDGK